MNFHGRYLAVGVVVLAMLLLSARGIAQGITTGTILGTVVDPAGAVVPNAEITATGTANGINLKTVSQGDGEFSLRAVPIGTYTLAVSATGFSPMTVGSVSVVSGVATDLKQVALRIGATEQVEINASQAALLNPTDSQVTTTFTAQTLEDAPLNNGFDTVTEVIPGVVSTHADGFSNTNGDNFSVNGQSGRFNNFEFDGQSNNDNTIGGPQIFFGNQDAIAEIEVITNDYGAQYGRNSGAVVNYITKSGTNKFHGSGFDYYQGQFLSSFENQQKNPLFGFCPPGVSSSTGCSVPVLPRSVENRYGGTLGGPILKDKLFFFGSTFWDRQHNGAAPSTDTALTPTPAGVQQLAAALPGNPGVAALQAYGPYAIPVGNPAPVGAVTNETVTGPGGVTVANVPFAFVQRLVASPSNDQEHLGRLDWQPTVKDHLFLRYFYQNTIAEAADGDIAAGGYVNSTDTINTVGADWSHVFSTNWVDQLRYSYQESKGAFDGGGYPTCTITNSSSCPASITINSGFDSFGLNTDFPQGRIVKVTQVQDNATWTHGAQTILFGGEVDYQNTPIVGLFNYGGTFTFNDFNNFIQDAPAPAQPASDAELALADGDFTTKYKETDIAVYLQDDWKIAPNFTAHLGLRWEYFGPSSNVLHDQSVARESNPLTAFWSSLLPLADRTVPAVQQYYRGFEPRIGLSWNPSFDSKLVVKAGYAINENPSFYNISLLVGDGAPFTNAGVIACTGMNCLPSSGGVNFASVRALNLPFLPRGNDPRVRDQETVPTNLRPPYTQTYTLAFDYEIGRAAVAEIRYVGSLTEKNFRSDDANPYLLPVQAAFPAYAPLTLCTDTTQAGYGRPNCAYGNVAEIDNGGWSNYNGLQMNLTTRSLHGATGTVSYTYSKGMDNATDAFRSTGSGGSSIAYPQNPLESDAAERGISGNSFKRVLGVQLSYELPKLIKGNGLIGRVTSGLTLSGFYRFSTGQPYTPYQPIGLDAYTPDVSYCDGALNSSSVGVGVDTCRLVVSNRRAPLTTVAYLNPYTGPVVGGSVTTGTPAYVAYGSDSGTFDANGNLTTYSPGTPIDPASAHWIINNQAYANAVSNPYPGQERNTQFGDNFSDLDATVIKTFAVTEGVKVQLSMTAYNALNQMYRGSPQGFVANGTIFGSYDYSSGSNIPGNTIPSGTRFVLLGCELRF
jgi:hypothetical protein